MNMQELKQAISAKAGIPVTTFTFIRQFAQGEDGNSDQTKPTEWVSHWDNDNRVRVTMHQDVMNTIKSNPAVALAFKYEEIPANGTPGLVGYRAAYRRFVVITPANVEFTI